MASHKAPAEVTVVAHEEQSAFAAFVDRHWMKAALVALVGAASILFTQYQASEQAAAVDGSWNKLAALVDESGGNLIGDPAQLEALIPELDGTVAGPWARLSLAKSLREEHHYDEAISALAGIKEKYPEHPLAKDRRTFGSSVTPITELEHLSKVYASEKKWRTENPGLFANPEPAPNSPMARIQTDHGDILVALDVERAPKHVENFTKLVNEGFYNGMKVHRSGFGQIMETGDPTTKDADSDPLLWGIKGAEPNIEAEETGLSHFAGVLSANSVLGTEETSGSLITLTAQPAHHLDAKNVVFGHVIEGLDIVEEICSLPPDNSGQRPKEPATIQSITILPGA